MFRSETRAKHISRMLIVARINDDELFSVSSVTTDTLSNMPDGKQKKVMLTALATWCATNLRRAQDIEHIRGLSK